MRDWILRLDRWLSNRHPGLYAGLLPGASTAELDDLEFSLGFRMPAAFRELYQWRNGQSEDSEYAFQYNFDLMPITEIKSLWGLMKREVEGGVYAEPCWWRVAWVPFLDSGSGNNRCIDTEGSFGGEPGQIVSFWHDDPSREIEFPTLDAWGETFVSSLEAGLWQVEDGNLAPALLDPHRGSSKPSGRVDAYDAYRRQQLPGYPKVHSAR